MSPKSAKKTPKTNPPPLLFLTVLFFQVYELHKGSSPSPRECNILSAPQFDMNLLTILSMYYIILLLMTDESTELFILLHFIYMYILTHT